MSSNVCVEPEGEQSSAVKIESSVAAGGWVQHAKVVVATVEAEVRVAVGSISDGSTEYAMRHCSELTSHP